MSASALPGIGSAYLLTIFKVIRGLMPRHRLEYFYRSNSGGLAALLQQAPASAGCQELRCQAVVPSNLSALPQAGAIYLYSENDSAELPITRDGVAGEFPDVCLNGAA